MLTQLWSNVRRRPARPIDEPLALTIRARIGAAPTYSRFSQADPYTDTPRFAKLAYLAHNVGMSTDLTELSVSQARDHFSDAVNRAAFGGEITYVTRGRNQQRAAAIVPAALVEQYEAMIDLEDGRIAHERLADLDAGRTVAVPADEAARALGL